MPFKIVSSLPPTEKLLTTSLTATIGVRPLPLSRLSPEHFLAAERGRCWTAGDA